MNQFTTLSEAQDFVGNVVDVPIEARSEAIRPGLVLNSSSIDLGGGRFTNSYDLVFRGEDVQAEIVAFDHLMSAHDFARSSPQHTAVSSGGFFYLADRASASPRQLALNLSISGGDLRSLPVSDRESIVVERGVMGARTVAALGSLLEREPTELVWFSDPLRH